MMKRKNTWKRLTASALALCVTFSCLPASALAAEAMAEDDAIRQTLLDSVDGEEYPQGMFDFLTPRMETSEDVGEAEFAIVRRGSTDEAASVTFKAIDMTAKYGEDYTLEVPGLLFDRELPHDPEARCSATIFLRNSDKINEKNEPGISLPGLAFFCFNEVAVPL